jgi:hypothetical protein
MLGSTLVEFWSSPPRTARGSIESAAMETTNWYVLLTSADGHTAFPTLGPYLTRELAENHARDSKVAHYRVLESDVRPETHGARG